MSIADDLRAARALIADPEHWTQGAYARDIDGRKVAESDPPAVRFCALGACWRIKGEGTTFVMPLVVLLQQVLPRPGALSDYNDSHTHAEVLALFDAAIAEAQRSEVAS